MSIAINFETSGAAFEDDYQGEIKAILSQAARVVEDYAPVLPGHETRYPLRDSWGNFAGRVIIKEPVALDDELGAQPPTVAQRHAPRL